MTTTLAESGLSSKEFRRLNLLLYGAFGTWKTVNAHGLPRTRTLDFDDGMQSVEWAIRAGELRRPDWPKDATVDWMLDQIVYETILPPASLDENLNEVFDYAADKVEEWVEEEDIPYEEWDRRYPQLWDTLIIDSGTSLTSSTMIKALKETDRLDLSKSWGKRRKKGLTPRMIQDYGAASILFEKFMTLCFGTGKNIVLICHEYQNTDKKGNLEAIEPLLIGQLRQSMPKNFDEVWYARVKGTKSATEGVFQTAPDPLRRCRSRLGCLDPEESADFDAIRKKVAEFYGVSEDNLWTAAHGTGGAKALIEEEIEESIPV